MTMPSTFAPIRPSRRTLIFALATMLGGAAIARPPDIEGPTPEQLRQQLQELVESGRCDLRVSSNVGNLPKDKRPPLIELMAACPHPTMRYQAARLIEQFPPQVANAAMRRLLKDKDGLVQTIAAEYWARTTKDADARTILFRHTRNKRWEVSVRAVRALIRLKGADVGQHLAKLAVDTSTPMQVRLAALSGIGVLRLPEATPMLRAMLDDRTPCATQPKDTMRMCDRAAVILESVHQINHTGVKRLYDTGPLERRDQAIVAWKKWLTDHAERPYGRWWWVYAGQLVEQTKTALPEAGKTERAIIKQKLRQCFGTTFCLGELPGIDAIVIPSLDDLWRVCQVAGRREQVSRFSLASRASAFERLFLPTVKKALGPREQALSFVAYLQADPRFDRLELWGLCRNFAARYKVRGQMSKTIMGLEREFAEYRRRVVLHGHIPVLEPVPAAKLPPGARRTIRRYFGYLLDQAEQEPSNWARHRQLVDYWVQQEPEKRPRLERYPLLDAHLQRYLANDWMHLADAIWKLRVLRQPQLALEAADRALTLNPDNAKAYALRGIARLAIDDDKQAALADLTQALERDPAALGNEPETEQAAKFLLAATPKMNRAHRQALAALKPFKSEHPSAEYQALLED